jgi:integrase
LQSGVRTCPKGAPQVPRRESIQLQAAQASGAVQGEIHGGRTYGLFNSPTFTEREIKPKTYGVASVLPWAAVIALYSGASLEEVCQLRREDLRIEHGNGWVIHITHEAALSGELKRKSRERTIPLHPELERLGLLKYHAALPRDAEWLFLGLPVHKSKNKRSPRVGRAFNNWRRQLGIDYKDRQLDFHSLRHTFGTAIEDVGITQSDRARLLGHAVPGIRSSVYSAPELKRVALSLRASSGKRWKSSARRRAETGRPAAQGPNRRA